MFTFIPYNFLYLRIQLFWETSHLCPGQHKVPLILKCSYNYYVIFVKHFSAQWYLRQNITLHKSLWQKPGLSERPGSKPLTELTIYSFYQVYCICSCHSNISSWNKFFYLRCYISTILECFLLFFNCITRLKVYYLWK